MEDSRVGSRQFVVFQNLWCFRIYVCLLSSYDERVASSVAEPEPVGAEVFWLEPEPIKNLSWSRSRYFGSAPAPCFANEKRNDLKMLIVHCTGIL